MYSALQVLANMVLIACDPYWDKRRYCIFIRIFIRVLFGYRSGRRCQRGGEVKGNQTYAILG